MPRSTNTSYEDFKARAAADIDRENLEAWASGRINPLETPNEFVQGSGAIGPRQIPASQPLSGEDREAIEAGAAVIAFPHDKPLSDADKAEIEAGRAVQLPQPIPADQADKLTAQQVADLAAGRATFVPAARPGDPQFSKDRFGTTEVPANDLQRGLDTGVVSLEDLASGKAKLIS